MSLYLLSSLAFSLYLVQGGYDWASDDFCDESLYEDYMLELDDKVEFSDELNHSDDRYEASGIALDVCRGKYWVVFDNLLELAQVSTGLSSQDLVDLDDDDDVDLDIEGYEGIVHDPSTDMLMLLVESAEFSDEGVYHPLIRHASIDGSDYNIEKTCAVDFKAPSDNKGFESLQLITINGSPYLLGLCEGNYCASGSTGQKTGHGRMVLMEYAATDTDEDYLNDVGIECIHEVIGTASLPSSADFEDYSGMHFIPLQGTNQYRVAVVSQASSALWLGTATVSANAKFSFDSGSQLFPFPRSTKKCNLKYCNVEGVHLRSDGEVVVVSDRRKSGMDNCESHDEAVQRFTMEDLTIGSALGTVSCGASQTYSRK